MKIHEFTLAHTVYTNDQFPKDTKPKVVILGRSNVGKSSLIQTLIGAHKLVKISSTPGCTKSINFYDINHDFYLVDFPGYGFSYADEKEKNRWDSIIRYFFKHVNPIMLCLVLVDSRRDMDSVDKILFEYIKLFPCVVITTKCDKLSHTDLLKQLSKWKESIDANYFGSVAEIIPFSKLTKLGRQELLNIIGRSCHTRNEKKEV